jgi:heat shock protein 1/8
VKFDIANGILSVTAVDKGTGKKQDITITGASTLPSDEVDRMVKELRSLQRKTRKRGMPQTQRTKLTLFCTKLRSNLKRAGRQNPWPVKEKVEA